MLCSRPKTDIVRQQHNTAEVVPFPKDLTPVWLRIGDHYLEVYDTEPASASPSAARRGKGPSHTLSPVRRALHFRDLQALQKIDVTERAANWIEGIAGVLLILLCAWAFVLLAATWVSR